MYRYFLSVVVVFFLATTVFAKNWNDGTGNWNVPGNWNPASVPGGGEAVNIVFADGIARTVTYDISAPSLGLLSIDLTGSGAAASALSISANNLAANGILVGGYSGAGTTTGRGALAQSAGTVTTNPGFDIVVGYGAGSMGAYTMIGGAVTASQSEFIGFSGTGTFDQSAGTNTINVSAVGSFSVGGNANSVGTYNLSGTGTLVANATEYIGNSGTGFFNQTGGTNIINGLSNLNVGLSSGGGIGTYTLTAGDLHVSNGENIGFNGVGTFVQSGGTNTMGGSLMLGNGSTSSGTYKLSGGTLS